MDMKPTHAGGVVYRPKGRGFEILLVRARDDSSTWVLPKGHIEPGERLEQTAEREVREEAGVEATAEREIGSDDFIGPRGAVRVVYFLMRYEQDVSADEDRERKWVPRGRARKLLKFPGAQGVMAKAVKALGSGARRQ